VHFRFRGNSIQVVKSQPNAPDGKAKSLPMGSINRETLGISDKLRNNCTAEELQEIESWVKRYHAVDALKRKHAALTLPEQIAAAIEWFQIADQDEAGDVADDVLAMTAMLRQVLNRRGLL
jgi:hypothetical protein